jgi:hypothetical protein
MDLAWTGLLFIVPVTALWFHEITVDPIQSRVLPLPTSYVDVMVGHTMIYSITMMSGIMLKLMKKRFTALDALASCYSLLLLCVLSGLSHRMLYDSVIFWPVFTYSLITYSIIFHCGGMSKTYTLSRQISSSDLMLAIVCSIVLNAVFVYFIACAFTFSLDIGIAYTCAMIGFILLHVSVLLPISTTIHIHHYYVGFIVALFCVIDSPLATVVQAMALAIHIHGMTVCGFEATMVRERELV